MAEHSNLYQRATYYDVIFDRDVDREVDFIVAAYSRYAGGELHSVLDIACGPGYHARASARRGLRVVGLDLRPEMLAFAQNKATAEGVAASWIEADMRRFQLDAPVDVAFCMFDGIDALLSNEDIIQHFRSVADNLTSRGLYIVDLTHPRDCSYEHYGSFRYRGQQDDVAVEIIWGTNNPRFDWVTGVAHVDVEMHINDHGHEIVIHDGADERLLLPQEVRLLADLSGVLWVVGWYGDFDLSQPLDDSPASRRMIAVLQKRG